MSQRDHGGNLNDAMAAFGGARKDWLDLSTGINPKPYPVPDLPAHAWAALPDPAAIAGLEAVARRFWSVPDGLEVVAASGASALIAQLPTLAAPGRVHIPSPTYNEHAAAFAAAGWVQSTGAVEARVVVNPNNPDGHSWQADDLGEAAFVVIDESFGDLAPEQTLLGVLQHRRGVVLKSFGKFWGLAGLRLGFAICLPADAMALRDRLGPWCVSGPAVLTGTRALNDDAWAGVTRKRLEDARKRLDHMLKAHGVGIAGGTALFCLATTADAAAFRDHLAVSRIWTRIFPYSSHWVRLGLPGRERDWDRLSAALDTLP